MKTLNLLILTIVIFLISSNSYSAETKWDIKGNLVEAETGIPVPYATVTLNNQSDSSIITGAVSNDNGEFVLEKIAKGDYYIKLSFIGYEDFYINSVVFDENEKTLYLGQVIMFPASALLDGVEITARVSPISNSIDKQVLNVDKNLSATGGTAIDAIRLCPSIQVDSEGGVKLRGSSKFTVLINGKPTTLTSEEVLRHTPANLISKIEVITAPSVKYDAEGGAGVINIILKKGSQSGLNGMLNATIGTKSKYSGDFSLNMNKKKISLSAGLDWRDYTKTAVNNYYRDLYKTDTIHHAFVGQDRKIRNDNLGIRFGLDFNPDEKNNLSYSLHSGYSADEADIVAKTSGYEEPASSEKYMLNTFYLKQKPRFLTNNLGYTRQLNDKGSMLAFNVYYSFIDYELMTSQTMSEADALYKPTDSAPYLLDISNDNYSHDIRTDIDYSLGLTENTKLEVGTSIHNYTRFLDITFAEFDHGQGSWVNHPDYTNKYDFKEDVYAGYANLNSSFWGIEASAGLRIEYMDRVLEQKTTNKGYRYNKVNFFPGFSLSKSIADSHSLMLSMTNRINRPDEYMMNPFPEFEDDYFYSEGNPYLLPEIVRTVELAYRLTGKKTVFSANLYVRQTTDKIEQRLTMGAEDKMHLSFHNDCKDQSSGMEIMGSFEPVKWWSINANANVFHYQIEGNVYEVPFSRSDVSWTAQLVNSFNIKENTSIQLIGYYASKTIRSQGELSSYYFVDVSLKQQFFKGRLSINLQLKDILQSLNYQLTTYTGNMDLRGDFINESPIFLISASFQISNYNKKTKDVQTEFDM